MPTAQDWIDALELRPHPEGGHFRETYRSHETIAQAHLPPRFTGDRALATAIYFLLQGDDFSALHRIRQDEVWHFYAGGPLVISVIAPDGELTAIQLGADLAPAKCRRRLFQPAVSSAPGSANRIRTLSPAAPSPPASTSPISRCRAASICCGCIRSIARWSRG